MPTIKGFTKAKKDSKAKRCLISVEGKERTGKTTFGLSVPGPLVYLPLDPGMEGVIDKVLETKEILLPTKENGEIEKFNYREATSPKDYERLWDKFKTTYEVGLASREIKSLVIDTGTEAWELLRLARFGKLTQVMPHHYGPVNAEFRDLIKRVYETDKNLVIIHKVKKEYVNDKTTGEFERAGFNDIGYLVQINLVMWWDLENGFGMTVRDCRQNMEIAGNKYNEPMNTFPFLASQVYPETSPEDWE
jgi:hypothetical protein